MRAAATIVMCVLAVTACSSHDTTEEVLPAPKPRMGTATSTIPPGARATTTTALPRRRTVAYAARARNSSIAVYPAPGARYSPRVLQNPWVANPSQPDSKVPQVFLVRARGFPPGWVSVLLPEQPNGSTGWVRSRDVSIERIAERVRVDLAAHRVTVFNGSSVVYRGPIAIGKTSTPTPTGTYYVRAIIRAPKGSAAYGPFELGLSSRSRDISNFTGSDGDIAIEGNNNAAALGHSVTGGAIRMDNDATTRLAGALPLGTPVDVAP
jgi:lipoprotein-anchoring transpeptidase ErfK/SrfK